MDIHNRNAKTTALVHHRGGQGSGGQGSGGQGSGGQGSGGQGGGVAVELSGLFEIRQFLLELNARFGPGIDTVLKANLGDLSLGAMLEYLVGLAVPGFRLQLSSPWDVINSINLRNLTFEINITQSKIGFAYDGLGVDLGFFSLQKVEVFFTTIGKRSVDISVFGRLLTQDFTKEPLTWDLLTQPPPTPPTKGPKTFDLEYLGLGQHVSLRDMEKLKTLGEVIEALKSSYRDVPKDENPLNQLPALKFDAGAGWLVGAQFSVLETVALSVVFNDPKMYGLRLSLAGQRAKSLAGLEFEILYQKVADGLGRYHIELKLPDALRQIQAGMASITLPIIGIDIYTNGNFLIDLGFPHNLDFTRSFGVQVMIGPVPVLGAGGVYFGVLNGQTAEDIPQITNGSFAPVIVFGIGARLGVGKTFNKGILKAGAYLAVQGLLEGALGFFQPTSPTVEKATFYRIKGAIGIVAHIYGIVDFSVVKATLDLYAYATVQGVFECYMPTVLSFEAGVKVTLKVRISLGFFSVTINLSFSATFKTSMEIGSAQPTPWTLGAGGESSANEALFGRYEGRGFRPLEGGRFFLDSTYAKVMEGGVHWRGVQVADEVPTLTLTLQPIPSIGFVDDHPLVPTCPSFGPDAEQQVQLAAVLFIQGPEQESGGAGAAGLSDFGLLAKYGLLWALNRVREARFRLAGADDSFGSHNGEPQVTLSELHFAYTSLTSPDAVDFCDIVDFLRLNFSFEIEPPPVDAALAAEVEKKNYVIFPMLPFLSMDAGDGAYMVNFERLTPCSDTYRRFLTEYFEQLAAQNTLGRQRPQRTVLGASADRASVDPSMAACMLMDYVLIILRQVLGKTIDLFESYPYAAQENDTLEGIAQRFGLVDSGAVARVVRANQSRPEFFAADTALRIVQRAETVGPDDTLDAIAKRLGLQAVNVALALQHQTGLLLEGASVQVSGGLYTLEPEDTLTSIAGEFFTTVEAIQQANPDFPWTPVPPGQEVPVGKLIRLPATDAIVATSGLSTLAEIAAFFRVSVPSLASLNAAEPILKPGVKAYFPLQVPVQQGDSLESLAGRFDLKSPALTPVLGNQQGLIATGTELTLSGGQYLLREKDTVGRIAQQFFTTEAAIFAANPGFDWTSPPGLAVPWGTSIRLPEVIIPWGITEPLDGEVVDSLGALARFVGLSVGQVVEQIQDDDKILVPSALVQLPVISIKVGSEETLESIAQHFGVMALNLALANGGPETRFGEVLVPEVETLPQETLLAELEKRGDFTASTGTVSRFLLHGLRLPSPDEIPASFETDQPTPWDDLCVYPLYTLTGQQWGAPWEPSVDYSIRLTLNPERVGDGCAQPKITFRSDTPDEGLTMHLSSLDVSTIEGFAELLNTGHPAFDPAVLALTRLAPYSAVGKHFSLGKAEPWQAPEVPLFTAEPLGQAAGQPRLYDLPQGLKSELQALGDRPAPLILKVGSQQLATGPSKPPTNAIGYGWVTRFEFRLRRAPAPGVANRFLPSLYEVYSADSQSRDAILELVTYLRGAGQNDEVTLHLLYSANPASSSDNAGLVSDAVDLSQVLLLKVNLSTLTRSPHLGLDLLEVPASSEEGLYSATLAEATNFLTLLWEASVVNSGGYYLSYQIGGGQGLPAQLFNENPEATLTMLAVTRPAGKPETIGLRPFHNGVVFTENLDSDDAVVFAEASRYPVESGDTWTGLAARLGVSPLALAEANATLPQLLQPGALLMLPRVDYYQVLPGDDLLTVSLATGANLNSIANALGDRTDVLLPGAALFRGPQWMVVQPSLPMGNEGFRMVRQDPDPEISAGLESFAQDDFATALQVRFNLLGFRLADGGAFQKSALGLPAGPGQSTGDAGSGGAGELLGLPATVDGHPPWLYQRALEVARHGRNAGPVGARQVSDGGLGDRESLPVPGPNPYTGLGSEADIHLQLQDLFGNLGLAEGVLQDVAVNILYRDLILGFHQWPANGNSYRLVPVGGQAQLELLFSLDPSHYTPPPGTPFAEIGQRAAKDRDLYQQVYWQVVQDDVTLAVTTTIDGEASHPLDKSILLPFLVAAWNYLDTIAAQEQTTVSVAQDETLATIAEAFRVTVAHLAELNGNDTRLLVPGAELVIPHFYSTVLNDTLVTILSRSGSSLSAGALGTLNRSQPLQVDTVLALPNGKDHTVKAGDTLSKIGDEQQPVVTPADLAELNKDLPNLFPQGLQLFLGTSTETIVEGDTFAAVARQQGFGVGALATFNADGKILQAGAKISIPSHLNLGAVTTATHLIAAGDTLKTVAAANHTTVDLLGLANQALDHVLAEGAELSLEGHQEKVLAGDNLATVLTRFRQTLDNPGLSAAVLAVANQEADILRVGSRMLVAPPVVEAQTPVAGDQFPAPIFPVTVAAVLRRSQDLIDPAFADVSGVEHIATPLAPRLATVEDSGLGLDTFAEQFEKALGQKVRLATGAEPDGKTTSSREKKLVAVQWQTPTLGYKIVPQPSFYAPRPLLNTPWAGPAWIRPYASGEPLGAAQEKHFQGIDLDTWGRSFLATMDQVLGSNAALAAYRMAPESFEQLATAKGYLAEAIGNTVVSILSPEDGSLGQLGTPQGDLQAAQKALKERLLTELSEAYVVDTVVQLPVQVTSNYSDPLTAPRLSGQPRGSAYVLPEGATLDLVAAHFKAPLAILAAVVAPVQEILVTGFEVSFDGKKYSVQPGDSLELVAAEVETTPESLAEALKTTVGFLRPGATVNLLRRVYTFSALDTLATALARLVLDPVREQAQETALVDFSAMNQAVPDIFRSGKTLRFEGKKTVTKPGDTLEKIGQALGATPLEVVRQDLHTEELTQVGTAVSLLVLIPGFSISDAKVPLVQQDDKDSSLTFLFQTNSELSRLSLEMEYQINELEYNIHDVSWAEGYQSSSWLSFIRPVGDKTPGVIDIPIPLRAYPIPPAVDSQNLEQHWSTQPDLEQIKTYDYLYNFTYQPAAQDTLFTGHESNVAEGRGMRTLVEDPTLPQCLAQFASINPTLGPDLALLSKPGALDDPALSKIAANAVQVFAWLAGKIAATWQTWEPATAKEPTDRPNYLVRHRCGEDGREHLRLQAANDLAKSCSLPELSLVGRTMQEETSGTDFVVHTFAPLSAEQAAAAPFQGQYQVRVPNLDVIGTQNIWGTVAVKRNYDLLPGKTTNPEFVYQLDDVRFTSKFVPLIQYPQALDVATLPPVEGEPEEPKLLKYLIRLFTNLLKEVPDPSQPQARNIRVSASFAYSLAEAPTGEDVIGDVTTEIDTRVPVVLQPVFLFDPAKDLGTTSGFCFELAGQLQNWLGHHDVESVPGGRWTFDVSVYSTLVSGLGSDSGTQPPLLELGNLYLRLKDLT